MIRARALGLATLGAIVLVLGGCGYKPLMAPCSPDDGVPPGYDTTPLAYSSHRLDLAAPFAPALPGKSAGTDACGPMKPI